MKIQFLSSRVTEGNRKVVTNPDIFSKKIEYNSIDGVIEEQKSFSDDGLFSKKIFGDSESQTEYSCSCGAYKGKQYSDGNFICPKCNTPVIKTEENINKSGIIDLGKYFLIKYIPYSFLEKVIGRENLKEIIHIPNIINMEGNLDTEIIENIRKESDEKKYWHIGINDFKKDYLKILQYYFDLHGKKEKDTKILEFLKEEDNVFTNIIPVISTVLRPAMRTEDGLKLDKLNIIYVNILEQVKILNDKVETLKLTEDTTLEMLQALYFQLSENILEDIKGKKGIIRNQICGTRINFSARNIISPAIAGYKIDEICVPYITFIHLYKYELINYLSRIKNITFIEAQNKWFKASVSLDEEVYKIIKKIISEEEVGVLLNRNPTISVESIVYLRIAGVKHDYSDMTMSIHNCIDTGLNADYDGDVLNLISIKDKESREVFKRIFSPINLIINPNDGRFNKDYNLEKDQILGINNLLI